MNAQICRELGVQSTEIAYGNLRYRDQKIEINKYKNQSETTTKKDLKKEIMHYKISPRKLRLLRK